MMLYTVDLKIWKKQSLLEIKAAQQYVFSQYTLFQLPFAVYPQLNIFDLE